MVNEPIMARLVRQGIVSAAGWLGDRITDCTGLAAVRVPLARAKGLRAKTLAIPGYAQSNSYGCGAVAAVMVARHFHPQLDFGRIYEAVGPEPEIGAGTSRVARALRACGVRVAVSRRLTFDNLCQAIQSGHPVLVVIRNPGADCRHWVVVYGYGRIPDCLYLANNGMPFFTSNRVSRHAFERLWEPKGNGLICSPGLRSTRPHCKPSRSK